MIIAIAAKAANNVIGNNGTIPWNYKSDMKHFKNTTIGKTVVMGRKTFDSIGKLLPTRFNIIFSKSMYSNAIVDDNGLGKIVNTKEEFLTFANAINNPNNPEIKSMYRDIFIIGGSEIYNQLSDIIERWIITEIPDTPTGDTYFNNNVLNGFILTKTDTLEDGLEVKTYDRI